MKRKLALLAALFFINPASAYNISGDRWPSGEAVFHVAIPGTAPSGITWSDAFEDAMAEWSEMTPFEYSVIDDYLDPCTGYSASSGGPLTFPAGTGDDLNGTDFNTDVCDNEFGEGVIAITLTRTFSASGNLGFADIQQTDIIFNANVNWNIYDGDPGLIYNDFRRVALHELGHALGLDHVEDVPSIMNPVVGGLFHLQQDDIDGAGRLYGDDLTCFQAPLSVNTVVRGSLEEGDCRVQELFSGGVDTSFVDVYRLNLAEETSLQLQMESAVMDSVVLIRETNLGAIALDDDSAGACDSIINTTLAAGEYLILANTWDVPTDCADIHGKYTLTVSDTNKPLLKNALALSRTPTTAIFSGGASADNNQSFRKEFSASESIDVSAVIQPEAGHIGSGGNIYVLAVLSNGNIFAKTETGKFVKVQAKLSDIPSAGVIDAFKPVEELSIINNLSGQAIGPASFGFQIFFGYSPESTPGEIFFSGQPISFSILP